MRQRTISEWIDYTTKQTSFGVAESAEEGLQNNLLLYSKSSISPNLLIFNVLDKLNEVFLYGLILICFKTI